MLSLVAMLVLNAAPADGGRAPVPAAAHTVKVGCDVPQHGRLELDVPAGWRVLSCVPNNKPPSMVLMLKPGASPETQLLIDTSWIDARTDTRDVALRREATAITNMPQQPDVAMMAAVAQGESPRPATRSASAPAFLKSDTVRGFFARPMADADAGTQTGARAFGAALICGELKAVVTLVAQQELPETIEALLTALKTARHVVKR